jgi:hypothetical protein
MIEFMAGYFEMPEGDEIDGGGRRSRVGTYGKASPGPEGSVMVVAFGLAGQAYLALNGGPSHKLEMKKLDIEGLQRVADQA